MPILHLLNEYGRSKCGAVSGGQTTDRCAADCPVCLFIPFADTRHPDSDDPGADALLYVMAYGHTISVPTSALYFAEKIAIRAIAAKDTPDSVLRDVNRAIDIITASIRNRERLDREATVPPDATPVPQDRPSGRPGKLAALQPQPINRPPSGAKVEIPF